MCELENCKGVMYNENEEWFKIWRGLDLSIPNWYEEFGKFWVEHLKFSKICPLMGCFCPKYTMFQLKKLQTSYVWLSWRLMQNLRENWLRLSEMIRRIWQFFARAREKVWKLRLFLDAFTESRKCVSFKCTGELPVIIMKNDSKFEEDLTCQFKIDQTNLTNFESSTWKSLKFAL